MATKLFSTTDRDGSHAKLEEILATGQHPRAECREDPNDPEPYSVWDDSAAPFTKPPDPPAPAEPELSEAMLDRLADKIAAKLRPA